MGRVRRKHEKVREHRRVDGQRVDRELLQGGIGLRNARVVDPEEELARRDAPDVAQLVARLAERAELHAVVRVGLRVREPLTVRVRQ